jgi:gentisate 1,2-dioxygenase
MRINSPIKKSPDIFMATKPSTKKVNMPTNNLQWEAAALFNEYMSAVNPEMPKITIEAFDSALHETGNTRIIPLDLSHALKTNYPATTPNLMANFVRICEGDTIVTSAITSSELFYVIRGKGRSETEWGVTEWSTGDVFVIPATESVRHNATSNAAFYWINDAPVLRYLGVVPARANFSPAFFSHDRIRLELGRVRKDPRASFHNRIGVLFANPACPLTKTITPTLWTLYDVLPAGTVQLPHRHNSVAIDFCVSTGSETYTLIGNEIDENGRILDPVKVAWATGSVFITPPGLWHSHHNDSGEDAYVLPIQDAGLVTQMRILDIQFANKN